MSFSSPISLIGMPGVGKSTVGKLLARQLKMPFYDPDKMITHTTRVSIFDYLLEHGEDALLDLEAQTTMSIPLSPPCVIATGGSIIYSQNACDWLSDKTLVVYLKENADVIKDRIDVGSRGIVYKGSVDFEDLYRERIRVYESLCDVEVELNGRVDVDVIVSDIVMTLNL